MTLSTITMIDDPVDVKEVFAEANRIIGAENPAQSDSERTYANTPGERVLMNEPLQGLPGWLMITYKNDAPLMTEDEARALNEADDLEDPDGAPHTYHQATYAILDIDTAYGYSDEHGRNAGDLHADFVARIGVWLSERGISWRWKNEYTGEIHEGPAGLDELVGSTNDARDWFTNEVMPVISSIAAKSG